MNSAHTGFCSAAADFTVGLEVGFPYQVLFCQLIELPSRKSEELGIQNQGRKPVMSSIAVLKQAEHPVG